MEENTYLQFFLVVISILFIIYVILYFKDLEDKDKRKKRENEQVKAKPIPQKNELLVLSEEVQMKKQELFTNVVVSPQLYENIIYEICKAYSLPELLGNKSYDKIRYSDLIQCVEWRYKRFEILLRDRFVCKDCGVKDLANHVHHTFYIKNELPWIIEENALVTLCQKCHTNRHMVDEIPIYTILGGQKIDFSGFKTICNRCSGSGYLPEFKHVEGGICFKCKGDTLNYKIFEEPLAAVNNIIDKGYEDKKIRKRVALDVYKIEPNVLAQSYPGAEKFTTKKVIHKNFNGDDDLPF